MFPPGARARAGARPMDDAARAAATRLGNHLLMNAHSHSDAAVEEIVRCLRGYRVLSRNALADQLNASCWPQGLFDRSLDQAVQSGRVVALSPRLYEIADSEKVFPSSAA